MLQIAPFQPLRYHPERISFISRVIAPPYDVIGPEAARELARRDEHNVIRLILGKEGPEGRSPESYERAAATLRAWRRQEVLVREPEPAIYVCEHAFSCGGKDYVRRGLFAAMLLEVLGTGGVMPHENTMAGPKADRMCLMKACRASLSQVFGVFSDAGGAGDDAIGRLADDLPLYEFADAEGVAHRVWRVTDRDRIDEVAALLRPETLLIADGHHRYETALCYRDEERPPGAAPGTVPQDFLALFCVSARNPGLVVLPTHRLVTAEGGWDAGRFLGQVLGRFDGSLVRVSSEDALREAVGQHIAVPGCIGCYTAGGYLHVLSVRMGGDLDRLLPDRVAAWRELAVTRLHYGIIEPAFGIAADIRTAHPRLVFTQDVAEIYWAVESGRAHAGFLLPPTPPETVEAIAKSGDRLPAKSTFFYPKVPSGLFIYPFDESQYTPRLPGR